MQRQIIETQLKHVVKLRGKVLLSTPDRSAAQAFLLTLSEADRSLAELATVDANGMSILLG